MKGYYKINLKDIGSEVMDCVRVDQEKDQWRALVETK
jgi:hypothetical protein